MKDFFTPSTVFNTILSLCVLIAFIIMQTNIEITKRECYKAQVAQAAASQPVITECN